MSECCLKLYSSACWMPLVQSNPSTGNSCCINTFYIPHDISADALGVKQGKCVTFLKTCWPGRYSWECERSRASITVCSICPPGLALEPASRSPGVILRPPVQLSAHCTAKKKKSSVEFERSCFSWKEVQVLGRKKICLFSLCYFTCFQSCFTRVCWRKAGHTTCFQWETNLFQY